MARPFKYVKLDSTSTPDHRDIMVLGDTRMYGIKKQEYWVALGKKQTIQKYTKYQQLFTTSRKVAQNQCDRLNDIFNTDEYRVVELSTFD